MQSAIRKEDLVKGKFKVSKALDIPYKQDAERPQN